jgi:hypothetical protein
MIRKSGYRFSEKIMLKSKNAAGYKAACCNEKRGWK